MGIAGRHLFDFPVRARAKALASRFGYSSVHLPGYSIPSWLLRIQTIAGIRNTDCAGIQPAKAIAILNVSGLRVDRICGIL
jgi:hypothetical protein